MNDTPKGLLTTQIMGEIGRRDGCCVSDLLRSLGTRRDKIDVTLRRLVQAGLVERSGDPFRYSLMESGQAQLADFRAAVAP